MCYLRTQLLADVIGVQGEQRLPRADVQDPLVVGQSQHAVVEHSLDAEPRRAVQHIWMETHRRIVTSLTVCCRATEEDPRRTFHTSPDEASPTPTPGA